MIESIFASLVAPQAASVVDAASTRESTIDTDDAGLTLPGETMQITHLELWDRGLELQTADRPGITPPESPTKLLDRDDEPSAACFMAALMATFASFPVP